ncbi:putative phenylalanine ammonia-lyase [Aspergillus sclerotioniger CBS 115572]|uniref:Putative phenylalanine ammonia-lyase n=1 Tax=Aspergillus sclerotioniger CBS 115572 TaxID=1450535 RepID=A0A317WTN4_9EURO|nr:putative phenylalanine ammonia-lyase [Aspergillus sclerotioniger CBS 115572]PWY89455.1 putative phenylalanine ammonia-lyase [Aspergillus sclerotioniger CBS 115572]
MESHLSHLQKTWQLVERLTGSNCHVFLDGDSLSLGAVVAVSRSLAKVSVHDPEQLAQRLDEGAKTLTRLLDRNEQVYGVNTGCGSNADTRTEQLRILQHSFLQHQQCGILPDMASAGLSAMEENSHSLPSDIVRATILLRCNSLLRGHSGVRIKIIDLLLYALNEDITPVVPLRGSLSASGDLSPLSYIGGLIEGSPDVYVRMKENGKARVMTAETALQQANIRPLSLNAKEGLSIVNGTAVSAAAASLVLYDSHNLALFSQVLTAMATEALLGAVDNYHEFISKCRPHPGQTEVARNICSCLRGSRLPQDTDVNKLGLVQDRYALRTAPQWIGPQLEDLLTADRQIDIELNSSTDNPLIDVSRDRFHHGGNFQAASVTSAMEKVRGALVMLGKILLGQCNELINPFQNGGLPPNLCADDPSLSFAVKGLDVHMTAYYSELAYLTNSVASHVQTAEMGNQSVNSLALISARYTGQSVQLLSMMCAAHLYVLCQALDLRALSLDFFATAKTETSDMYCKIFITDEELDSSQFENVWFQIESTWLSTAQLDLSDRCEKVAAQSVAYLMNERFMGPTTPSPQFCSSIKRWRERLSCLLCDLYNHTRAGFTKSPSTPSYLGEVTRSTYEFVRHKLAVPFHRGVSDHPTIIGNSATGESKKTIGFHVTRIYVAVENGDLMKPIKPILKPQ